jgi:hypothetical protein
MDDIRPQDLPAPPASEGAAPQRQRDPHRVGPEDEDRGGPEVGRDADRPAAPAAQPEQGDGLPEPLDPAVKG